MLTAATLLVQVTRHVRAFLQDYTDNMGWEQLNDRHEYGSNIIDALGMFEAGMTFQLEQEGVVE
jgi:hypothetical protein